MQKPNTFSAVTPKNAALHANKIPFSFVILAARLRRHLKLKVMIVISLLIALFGPFLIIERWPLLPVTIYQETWLDRAIPFTPIAAWPYLSLWLYLAFAGLMLVKRKDLWRCCWIMAGMGLIGNIVFLIHPTSVPVRPAIPVQPYAFIIANDQTGNACPSLHVAFTLFAAVMIHDWLVRFRRNVILRSVAWTWALIIILSTIAIRQHLAIDVVWGAVLGLVGGMAWHISRSDIFNTKSIERQSSGWNGEGNAEEIYGETSHQQTAKAQVLMAAGKTAAEAPK